VDIITGLTGKNLTQTFKMAEDRQEWKAITRNNTWIHDARIRANDEEEENIHSIEG